MGRGFPRGGCDASRSTFARFRTSRVSVQRKNEILSILFHRFFNDDRVRFDVSNHQRTLFARDSRGNPLGRLRTLSRVQGRSGRSVHAPNSQSPLGLHRVRRLRRRRRARGLSRLGRRRVRVRRKIRTRTPSRPVSRLAFARVQVLKIVDFRQTKQIPRGPRGFIPRILRNRVSVVRIEGVVHLGRLRRLVRLVVLEPRRTLHPHVPIDSKSTDSNETIIVAVRVSRHERKPCPRTFHAHPRTEHAVLFGLSESRPLDDAGQRGTQFRLG